MDITDFVLKCGELLRIAKPHLVSCEHKKGRDIHVKESNKQYECYNPDYDYVVITSKNGVRYVLPIDGITTKPKSFQACR